MQQGALDLLAAMGRAAGSKRLSIGALKPVEHLHLPENMRELISKFVPEQGTKATTEAVRRTCAAIARRRYWAWVLLHPQLTAEYIHPTRSVPPFPAHSQLSSKASPFKQSCSR